MIRHELFKSHSPQCEYNLLDLVKYMLTNNFLGVGRLGQKLMQLRIRKSIISRGNNGGKKQWTKPIFSYFPDNTHTHTQSLCNLQYSQLCKNKKLRAATGCLIFFIGVCLLLVLGLNFLLITILPFSHSFPIDSINVTLKYCPCYLV